MRIGNLFADASPPLEGERFETLLAHKNFVVERILSSARIVASEYFQSQDEWVVLLSGEALLDVAGKNIALKSGDYLFLPSKTSHTLLSVSEGALWLAIHMHEQRPPCENEEENGSTAVGCGEQREPHHPPNRCGSCLTTSYKR